MKLEGDSNILRLFRFKIPDLHGLGKKISQKLKGSRQDPLFCLGCLSLGLFLVILVWPLGLNKNVLADSLDQATATVVDANDFALGPTPGVLQPPDFYLVQKNSLKAISIISNVRPQVLATLSGEEADIEMGKSITEYVVKAGDTLSSIAQQFNISLTTLLGTNNLTSSSPIASGKKLVILPVSGVMYLVKAGDTLGEVARKYKGDLTEVIAFNELTDENDIFVGDIVIIPNGVLPPPPVKRPAETLAPLASGYFVCPITGPCRVTQRLHWYNAVDLSHGSCGEPVYAAASGKVQKVKLTSSASRWTFGGAGNHLTILHPNGVVTFYGHLASALVSPGQEVTQGQTIALMGGAWGMAGSGNSTGCHLHFQVTGAKNPFNP